MFTTVKLQMDSTQKIMLKRYINKDGQAQRFFTKEVEKAMNPYVPWLTGNLKDASVTVHVADVTYNAPYAQIQYRTNTGMGKEGLSHGGLRGSMWDKRAWSARGSEIVRKVAVFVGGRT
jgi:hypothetical protein